MPQDYERLMEWILQQCNSINEVLSPQQTAKPRLVGMKTYTLCKCINHNEWINIQTLNVTRKNAFIYYLVWNINVFSGNEQHSDILEERSQYQRFLNCYILILLC